MSPEFCGSCGHAVGVGNVFCMHCGRPLRLVGAGLSGGMVAIGVLSIIGGAFTLIAAPLGAILAPMSKAIAGHNYAAARLPIDFVMAAILVITGVGTLARWGWVRPVAIVYAWGRLALVGVGVVVTYASLDNMAPAFAGVIRMSLVVGPLVAAAYPTILLIFYTRPGVIAQFRANSKGRAIDTPRRR